MARRALQVAVAALVVATTALVLPSEPAAAAGCSSADGVSVVVDFHEARWRGPDRMRRRRRREERGRPPRGGRLPLTFVQRQPVRLPGLGPAGVGPVREHAAGRRVLGALLVRRLDGQLDLLHPRRGLADGAGRRLGGALVDRQAPAGPSRASHPRCTSGRRRRHGRPGSRPTSGPTSRPASRPPSRPPLRRPRRSRRARPPRRRPPPPRRRPTEGPEPRRPRSRRSGPPSPSPSPRPSPRPRPTRASR